MGKITPGRKNSPSLLDVVSTSVKIFKSHEMQVIYFLYQRKKILLNILGT